MIATESDRNFSDLQIETDLVDGRICGLQVERGAKCRMAGKWQFFRDSEDADLLS